MEDSITSLRFADFFIAVCVWGGGGGAEWSPTIVIKVTDFGFRVTWFSILILSSTGYVNL